MPTDNGSAIAAAILRGTASAVSDGSYDGVLQRGSSAFIISPNDTEADISSFIRGGNLTAGNPSDQSAY